VTLPEVLLVLYQDRHGRSQAGAFIVLERDEVLDGRRLGRETMDFHGLPMIDHLEDVIGLCLCKKKSMSKIYGTP
jgi:hypothetical protein